MDTLGLLNQDDLSAIVAHINLRDNLELSSAAFVIFDRIMDETLAEQSSIYAKDRLLLYLEQCNLLPLLMENFLWRLTFVEKTFKDREDDKVYSSVSNLGLTNIIKIQAIEFLLKYVNSKFLNISHFLLGFYKIPTLKHEINCLSMICNYLDYELKECKFLFYESRKMFVEKCLELLSILLNNNKYCYETSKYIQDSDFLSSIQNPNQIPYDITNSILRLTISNLICTVKASKEQLAHGDFYIPRFLIELLSCKHFFCKMDSSNKTPDSEILIETFTYLLIVMKIFNESLCTSHAHRYLFATGQIFTDHQLFLIFLWFFRKQWNDQNPKLPKISDCSINNRFKLCLFVLDAKYEIFSSLYLSCSDSFGKAFDDFYSTKFLFVHNYFKEKGGKVQKEMENIRMKESFNRIRFYFSDYYKITRLDSNLKLFLICKISQNLMILRLLQWNINFNEATFDTTLNFLDALVVSNLISIDQYIANLKNYIQINNIIGLLNGDFSKSNIPRYLVLMYSIFKTCNTKSSFSTTSMFWDQIVENLNTNSLQSVFRPILYMYLAILFSLKKISKSHFDYKSISPSHLHFFDRVKDPIIAKWSKIMIDI